jgi:hypothetical protein
VKIDKVTAILAPRSAGASCRWHRARRKSLYGALSWALWWIFKKTALSIQLFTVDLSKTGFPGTNRRLADLTRENDDISVRLHTVLEQYCCPRNSDSYFVDIGYDTTVISFVDLHTAVSWIQGQYCAKTICVARNWYLRRDAVHLFIRNLLVCSYWIVSVQLYSSSTKFSRF